jgi:hypothetical protein
MYVRFFEVLLKDSLDCNDQFFPDAIVRFNVLIGHAFPIS